MIMMQRVLSQKLVRQVAAARLLLVGVSNPPVAVCSCIKRLSPSSTAHRWLSTSATSKAQHPKQHQEPPPDEPRPSSTPEAQAGSKPPHGEQSGTAVSPATATSSSTTEDSFELDPLQDKSIGLYQRFKRMFKQYGKVMIPVHLLTSSVWLGTYYYAAMKGVNVVPFLEMIGLPDSIVDVLRNSSSTYLITAYAMYKITTPIRYTVTLGGTSLAVQYLRSHGYMATPPSVKEYFQDKMEENKEKLSEKMEETRERFSEKMEETRELFSGRIEETKERLSEKMDETKDMLSEKLQETKEKVSDGKSLFRNEKK